MFPAGCCAAGQSKTSGLACEEWDEPQQPHQETGRRASCSWGCQPGTEHLAQDAAPAPLCHSGTAGRDRMLKRGTGSGSPAARLGHSMDTLLLPCSGLRSSSSRTSTSHLKTSTANAFSGRLRHQRKHLPPFTVLVRRRERERNLEGILGRRERRTRKMLLAKKASWGLPV